MELLKLVIVDDEPILLQGLLNTYDWADMGFEVVGTAQSGEQALEVIRQCNPHVVLTDIRMKKITGLMVMEEIQKEGRECLFVVLSAYRDFEYAQQACELGAFAYLLKPIEDEKLTETMKNACDTCKAQIENETRYENWEKLLKKDANNFLQVVLQKYIQNRISEEEVKNVFEALEDILEDGDRFISVCVDIDLAFKITNTLEYEAARFSLLNELQEQISKHYFNWRVENEDQNYLFIVKAKSNTTVRELKTILEDTKKKEKSPVIAAISKPYKGIAGIKKSSEEAQKLFAIASVSGASAFTISEEIEEKSGTEKQENERAYSADSEQMIVNTVRKNSLTELKDAYVRFIYDLPKEEELQKQYMHRVMLKTEIMLNDSYGMKEELAEKFCNYYSNLQNLSAAKAVDVSYRILCSAIDSRVDSAQNDEEKYFKEYMSEAVAYIEEHLNDESLSIVSVASHIYLNSVYFGRVFKNTFNMTFKKYLLKQRMEKAKRLMIEGNGSIADICEQVGITNPSYFSHLFKEYTGKLPSEYKKEYEG